MVKVGPYQFLDDEYMSILLPHDHLLEGPNLLIGDVIL